MNMTDSPKIPAEKRERPYALLHQRSGYIGFECKWTQAWKQLYIQLGARNPADAIQADQHEIRATHNSFLRHDQAKADAAARTLMRMRHGPPDTTATVRRHERARDKVSIVVGINTTSRKTHLRFRWNLVTNGRNVKIHMEATTKGKTVGEPYTS